MLELGKGVGVEAAEEDTVGDRVPRPNRGVTVGVNPEVEVEEEERRGEREPRRLTVAASGVLVLATSGDEEV